MTATHDPHLKSALSALHVPKSWADALSGIMATPQTHALEAWLNLQEKNGKCIFPPRSEQMQAFELTPLDDVRVVILGQDPYHRPGQAHGLAFSVRKDVKVPPSLVNIYKELASDCGVAVPGHGNLEHWARQGVLLLNNVLSVEEGRAGSHHKQGWEAITDAAVAAVAAKTEPCVFLLWGGPAQAKAMRVPGLGGNSHHLVLTAPHPSPLSAYRGFFGCQHFSQANAFLEAQGRGAIRWS